MPTRNHSTMPCVPSVGQDLPLTAGYQTQHVSPRQMRDAPCCTAYRPGRNIWTPSSKPSLALCHDTCGTICAFIVCVRLAPWRPLKLIVSTDKCMVQQCENGRPVSGTTPYCVSRTLSHSSNLNRYMLMVEKTAARARVVQAQAKSEGTVARSVSPFLKPDQRTCSNSIQTSV